MQQHIYKQLSELMGGLMPPYVIPAHGGHVLDIGWGMGESVHELALKYPSEHITGIDRMYQQLSKLNHLCVDWIMSQFLCRIFTI